MAENFPKWITNTKMQIQKAPRIPCRVIAKKLYLGISYSGWRKTKKDKEKIPKELRQIQNRIFL